MSDITERPSNIFFIFFIHGHLSNTPKLFKHANKILSASINVDSDRNWFAYTTRMNVRLDIADIVIKHNPKKAKSSLENAKKMVIFALNLHTW
jgi:hypothetical protein